MQESSRAETTSVVQSCAQSSSFFSTASSSSSDSQFSLVLGSSWRHGEGAVAFRPGCSCTIRIASTSGSKGMRCNGRCSTQLLVFDPDSLHFVTTCSFPPGSFLGAIQRPFFDVRYARSSAVAHRHIGATYWLVTARLYNLKRPKSQFYSTMRALCVICI
jgi:hypothetical protein